jgi:TP901 family phage tail tape measure protein
MAIQVGKSTSDLSGGAYQIISAFGDTANSVAQLEISAKAATAGVATTKDAIDLLSSVSKGYGDTSNEMLTHISDLAFQTVKLGQTTFPELAASIGRVVPLSNELGISQEELFAVFATGTGVTGQAAEVSTQFRGVLQSLLSPTAAMTELIKLHGYESGKAMLKGEGLAGVLTLVKSATEATKAPMSDYISSIEGQTIALALSGSQAETLAQKTDAMRNVVGATEQAFKDQTQGVNAAGFAFSQAKISFSVFMQVIGDALGPVIGSLSQSFTTIVSHVVSFARENPKLTTTLTLMAAALGVIATTVGGLLLGSLAIPSLVAAFTLLSTFMVGTLIPAIASVGVALGVSTGGLTFILAGIALAVVGIIKYWDELAAAFKAGYTMFIKPSVEGIKLILSSVWNVFSILVDGLIEGWNSIWGVAETVWNAILDTVKNVLSSVYDTFRWVLEKLGIELPAIGDAWDSIGEKGQSAAGSISGKWTEFKDLYKKNMAEQKDEFVKTSDEQVAKNVEAVGVMRAEAIDYAAKKKALAQDVADKEAYLSAYMFERHIKDVIGMLAAEENKQDESKVRERDKSIAQLADIEKRYGKMLDAEQLKHAQTLAYMGEDWEDWVLEVTKPTWYENMWTKMGDNFNRRLGEMGDAWMKAFTEGNFKNGIQFAGEYLKSTFEAAFMDIGGSILQKLVDTIKDKLSGIATSFGSSLLSSVTSAGSSVATGASGAGAAGTGAAAAGLGAAATIAAPFAVAAGIALMMENNPETVRRIFGASSEAKDTHQDLPKKWQSLVDAFQTDTAHPLGRDQAEIAAAQYMLSQSTMNVLRYAVLEHWYKNIWLPKYINDPNTSPEAIAAFTNIPNASRWLTQLGTGSPPKLMKDNLTITNASTGNLRDSLFAYQYAPDFHTGGIIDGILGQERLINALAGEEILTRDDPRHSLNNNFGGFQVTITGNTIASEMDMRKLGNIAADSIWNSIKNRTRVQRY